MARLKTKIRNFRLRMNWMSCSEPRQMRSDAHRAVFSVTSCETGTPNIFDSVGKVNAFPTV
jgi:hypothetical protein